MKGLMTGHVGHSSSCKAQSVSNQDLSPVTVDSGNSKYESCQLEKREGSAEVVAFRNYSCLLHRVSQHGCWM